MNSEPLIQNTPLGTAPLVPVAKDGKLLRTRIKNATEARNIYRMLRKADETAARDRARIQSMIDGEAPYDQAQLINQGLGEIANVNWGQAEQILNLATSPYIDLQEAVEVMITTPTRFGDPQMRQEWEAIIAEEFTRMLRTWPEFFPRYLYLIQQFLAHGVAIAYFDDDIDWRPQISPLGDFLIPRQTRASDEEIEVACFVRSYPPHELYTKIEDENLAAELGWNVKETKRAIVNSRQIDVSDSTVYNWETLQREFKNNDIGVTGGAKATEIKVVHMLVKELDGTVSQYLFTHEPEDGDNQGKEFMFQRRHRYEDSSQAFVSFCYGVGSNGYFHSIRGLGSKIFSIVQALNRLRCRMYDGIMMSSMQMIEPENEDALEDLSVLHIGPYMVKPANVKIVSTEQPNLGQSVMPGMADLNSLLQQQAGQYATEAMFNATRERSAYEVRAQLESLSNINLASLVLFYSPWERLLREVLRRATRTDYYAEDPGGREVIDFKTRCIERGVPEEALALVDVKRARVARAIGNGSSAARSAVMQQIYTLSANFDPEGKRQSLRDLLRTIGGAEVADRYVPPQEGQRPPMEAKLAMLENNQLIKQEEVPVLPSEMHSIHFPIHYQEIQKGMMDIEEGRVSLVDATPSLVKIFEHASQHAEFMQGFPEYPQVKQAIQQAQEYISNGVRAIQKLQREQMEQQQMAPQEAAPQGNADLDTKLVEARVKLQMAEELHQQKLRFNEELTRQQIALKDAETAADIARKAVARP